MHLQLLGAEISKEVNERFDYVSGDLEAEFVLKVQVNGKAYERDRLEDEEHEVEDYPHVHPMPVFVIINAFTVLHFKNEQCEQEYC